MIFYDERTRLGTGSEANYGHRMLL